MLGNSIANGEVFLHLVKLSSGLIGDWHRLLNEIFI